jgi:hypothetical protein
MTIGSRSAPRIGGMLLALVSVGCRQPQPDAESTSVTGRIVHGIVSVTGTSFSQQLVLENGSSSIRLLPTTPSDSAALTRLGGVEVSVRGADAANGLRVDSFVAQRVSGRPVFDGYLRSEEGRLYLETPSGRMALGNPPRALNDLVGARIWIDGPLDRGPNNFGVIIPRS